MNFEISGHLLRVVELDGFAIKPKVVNRLMLSPGETAAVVPIIRKGIKIPIKNIEMSYSHFGPSPWISLTRTATRGK